MAYILGIDVGGTKVAAGLVNARGQVFDYHTEPTAKTDLVRQLVKILANYRGFLGVGLGLPGPVLADGKVQKLPNLPKFKPMNLRLYLEKRFKKPVTINNDAKCFALAEATFGQGKNFKTVAGVILGTGMGVGIVIDKKIYRGAEGLAGEFGQFPMLDEKTLERHVQSAGHFKSGRDAEKYLRLLVSYVVLSFNPEIIIFGGAWSKLPGILSVVRQSLKRIKYSTQTKIRISELRYAGVIGAALPLLRR